MNPHQLYIQRCFDLANLASGNVTPNPKVGAVIVHNHKIIGEGYHQFPGGAHAEINAINSLKDKSLLSSSFIYISLEPCNNHGKTPPCVDALLKYKIPKVYISVIDPNPLTLGQSVKKLRAAGVQVKTNILSQKGRAISANFLSIVEKKRPYVVLKLAQSINKKMGVFGKNIGISNAYTRRLTHKWRSEINAIIVGTGTIVADNPKLDNRLYFGNSPVKLLLKRDGKLSKDLAVFQSQNKTVVICEDHAEQNESNSLEYWKIPFDNQLLEVILNKLKTEGINSLLVEGGAQLLQSFIQENLWDEARVFTGNKIIPEKNSINAPSLAGNLISTHQIGDNKLEIFKNNTL